MVLIVFIVSLCATLPLWVYLSRRVSKSRLIAIGTIALGIATGIVYPILPKQSMTGPIFMALIGGIFLGSTGLLESLLVDVAEISNIAESAMGQVFGIWKFVAKAARAAAIAIGGYALGVVGYTPLAATVPPDVAKSIGFLFGPIVAVFFILSGVIILFVREIKPDQSTT
jgi:Na+/melibiose symporter-like transporter